MEKKLASPKLHELRAKLQALAERGVNGEKEVARDKLSRLMRRYDFTTPNNGGTDIFAGVFIASPGPAAPIMQFAVLEYDIANAVKWAIETETGIPCLYHGDQLCAQAEATTANRLHDIAATLSANFAQLWKQFALSPEVNPADRANFILGLYEGLLDEERTGDQLPARAHVDKVKRLRKKDKAPTPGLTLHPYSVAVKLGREIRFCVPILDIAGELERTLKGELPECQA